MSVTVTGPDGLQYQFPDGTDKDAAISYFKKKGIGTAPSAPNPPAGHYVPQSDATFTPPPTLQQKLSDVFMHPLDSMERASQPINRPANATIPEMAATDLYNVGAGATGVVRHPLNTLAGILGGIGGVITAPFESMAGQPNEFQQLYDQANTNGPQTGATMVGQSLAIPAAAKVMAPVAAPVLDAAGRMVHGAAQIVPRAARAGADILAGTTPKVAQELGEQAKVANDAAVAKAAADNAKLQTQRGVDLQKHFERTQAIRAQNEAAQAVQSRKAALERGVEQLDPKFQDDLKATEKSVRAQANEKYNTVRAATEGETVPSGSLADAVKAAEAKIQGSSENLKIFRDILSKHPEDEPESITYQGAQIPKGHPLYDVLAEGAESTSSPATFSDLQGYYSELGNQIAKGNLPGDVYQAMKSLQGSVGDLMQQMAESKGVGGALTDARGFYSRYMDAFRDSRSPLNRAMNATERGKAIAALRTADQGGIETLAQYNPDLAKRANTIRGYQAEAKAIPARTATSKPEPTLPPKPAPIEAQTTKVGPEDIRNAKAAALEKQTDYIRKRGSLIASGIGAYRFLHSLMSGDIGGAAMSGVDTAIGLTATQVLAKALENPRLVHYLTNPTPSDIAAIPPEIRADLPQIVKAAQAQGIKVHPALLMLGGSAAQQAQPQQ